MRLRLTITDGTASPKHFDHGGPVFIIGRDPNCGLVLDGPTAVVASWQHARVEMASTGAYLTDLGSSNGTFLNDRLVTDRTLLKTRDQVRLGRTGPLLKVEELVLASDKTPQPAPPSTTSPSPATIATGSPMRREQSPNKLPAAGSIRSIVRIGRASDNEVVFDFPIVSNHHARLVSEAGSAYLEDLGSANGTAIGDPEAKINRAPLNPQDVVYLGSLRVPADRLFLFLTAESEPPPSAPSLGETPITIGRDPACERRLDNPTVSWRHAELTRQGDTATIRDLRSTNGTYVNGQRIGESQVIRAGDVIHVGAQALRLTAEGKLQLRNDQSDVTVEARLVRVDVPGACLLDEVSLTLFPSEMVGLMGPSGAGKTTLLNALNGYTRPSQGHVYVNGLDLFEHYGLFRAMIGYVPQDDIIHRDLTVGQALYFSARLRLPSDHPPADLQSRIGTVIRQLGLEGTENILIGSAERKGISGGQRKRVNLAMELLTDPQVLFLDEPTSGLSSEDALMVMRVLRGLADAGKTIFLTIHQPSAEAFRLFDLLTVVAKDRGTTGPGRLVYHGPAYPQSMRFFQRTDESKETSEAANNPDDVLRCCATRKAEEWVERFRKSDYFRDYVQNRAGKADSVNSVSTKRRNGRVFDLHQWAVLVTRSVAIKIKDAWNTAILLVQAPIVAILIVLVLGSAVGARSNRRQLGSGVRGSCAGGFLADVGCLVVRQFQCHQGNCRRMDDLPPRADGWVEPPLLCGVQTRRHWRIVSVSMRRVAWNCLPWLWFARIVSGPVHDGVRYVADRRGHWPLDLGACQDF